MREFTLVGAADKGYFCLSSYFETIPPTTHRATSKEVSQASMEEEVEIIKLTFPILSDTQ